jgi:hypothetical protein
VLGRKRMAFTLGDVVGPLAYDMGHFPRHATRSAVRSAKRRLHFSPRPLVGSSITTSGCVPPTRPGRRAARRSGSTTSPATRGGRRSGTGSAR